MVLVSLFSAALSVGALVEDLEQGGANRDAALMHISENVETVAQGHRFAPPAWFDCVSAVHERGILEMRLKRMAQDGGLSGMEASGFIERTLTEICGDELHEN